MYRHTVIISFTILGTLKSILFWESKSTVLLLSVIIPISVSRMCLWHCPNNAGMLKFCLFYVVEENRLTFFFFFEGFDCVSYSKSIAAQHVWVGFGLFVFACPAIWLLPTHTLWCWCRNCILFDLNHNIYSKLPVSNMEVADKLNPIHAIKMCFFSYHFCSCSTARNIAVVYALCW